MKPLTPDELTDDARIRRAIGAMPYGGIVHKTPPYVRGQPITLWQVAEYLESLKSVLTEVAEQNQREHREITQIRSEIHGAASLLKRLIGADS